MASPRSVRTADMDIAPAKRWKRFIPSWLRSLIWADSAAGYDAFLSYSWASDKQVAPVIQAVIQRFLCPWYKIRAKTVFRDLSSLPAGSSLENELLSRLDRSSNLLVLASPEAANSRGMEMEAQHWLSRERSGEVLIVVTAGPERDRAGDGVDDQPARRQTPSCNWDDIREHLLPPTLRARFGTSEPLWISVDHRRADILADPSNEGVRGQVIEDLKQVFLRLYPGTTWEELRGEERTQKRRAMGLMSGAATLFLVAALIILWQLWSTTKARNEAALNYKSAMEIATAISKVVREQLQPDGAVQPKSVLANELLNSSELVERMSENYEYPAAALSRVQLLESLWNNNYILGKFSNATDNAKAEFQIAQRYEKTRHFQKGDPSHADWLRYMCRANENLGDDARAMGDRKGAERYFQQAVEHAERLSLERPAGAWKNELPHAYERLGDALRDDRKFTQALANFRKFVAIQSAGDLQDITSQRNLAVVHGKIGDILIEQRDLDGAEGEFKTNLAISQKLTTEVPNSLDLQRGVAVAHERLGFVRRKRAKFSDAIQDYQQELAIVKILLQADKEDVQWERDEALANEGLGDVSRDTGQFSEANEYYKAYLKSISHVRDKSQANARIRREVAVAYQRLGDVALRIGSNEVSKAIFQQCLKNSEKASTAFEPRNPEPQDVGGYCRTKIAEVNLLAAK
jgi:tetratricopeptide (TPR) repeat protein